VPKSSRSIRRRATAPDCSRPAFPTLSRLRTRTRTTMNSENMNQPSSALYQYAVPGIVFVLAAISISAYFRATRNSHQRLPSDFRVALRHGQQGDQFDPKMKPPLFDAYLEDIDVGAEVYGQPQGQWDLEAQWAEIIPLSATSLDSANGAGRAAAARAAKRVSAASPPPPLDAHSGAEVDPRPPDGMSGSGLDLDLDLARVLVSVIVRMPVPPEFVPVAGKDRRDEDEGDPLPYLELGLVEVDVL